MQSRWPYVLVVSCLLGGTGAAALSATVKPASEITFRSVCIDSGVKKHPKKAELSVTVPDDRFASDSGGLVGLIYRPEPSNSGRRGKITAKFNVTDSDGLSSNLGKETARQGSADAPVQLLSRAATPLREGDEVEISLTFKKFDALRGRECFTLLGLVTPAE